EVGSRRVAQARDPLESPGIVLVPGHLRPGAASAAAHIAAEPAAEIAIEQGIGLQARDTDVIADAEVRRGRGGSGRSANRRDQRRADGEVLDLRALVGA